MPQLLDRDYRNYGGQKTSDYDHVRKKVNSIFEIAARFILTTQTLQLTFEGWESTSDFDTRKKPQTIYRRTFDRYGADFTAVRTQFASVFDALEAATLEVLEVDPGEYDFEGLTINANEKRIVLSAKHKQKNRRVSEQIDTEEGFDQTLLDNPELVQAYFTFVWTFGKMNDQFLASLQPAV